jgi:hypothetical protein
VLDCCVRIAGPSPANCSVYPDYCFGGGVHGVLLMATCGEGVNFESL